MDHGGTWTRVKLIDSRGRTVRSTRLPAGPLADLPGSLKTLFGSWKVRPAAIVAGARGVWTRSERRAFLRRLSPLADHAAVLSDVELAHRAAFGGRPGILVVAGTGSIAFGRSGDRFARAGGLNPPDGDPGSGFWIGRRWLKRSGRGREKRSMRATAALARAVLWEARHGRREAARIVTEAQTELVRLIGKTLARLKAKRLPVASAGGLFENRFFREGLYGLLKSRLDGKALRRTGRKRDAARTAAELALRLGTADAPPGLVDELEAAADLRRG